ncbi:MAG: hypothetical protein JWM43_2557 [Acidobacteriaceae bacterium]|nr:hypothetical protein [Acidobacteriaceae bacterium]
MVTLLTLFALAVHGYHPYAEDGGLYMAGVKRLLNPALYPQWSEFVTEHLRFSLFAPLIAALVRLSHLSLMTVWMLLYIASFWTTLFAAWLLAERCYSSREARCGAVALLAVWLPIPIAGTSLMLMDPYFSARSISTPCALLALVGILDCFRPKDGRLSTRLRGAAIFFGALIVALLVHPLMAAYALGCALLLSCLLATRRTLRIGGTAGLCLLAVLAAATLYSSAPPETAGYLRVALTRTYWFLGRWQWYEQFGLIAPLAILAYFGWRPAAGDDSARGLARTGTVAASVAILVALLFARTTAPTYLVARLQPLRIFQIVYVLMILALGAMLGEKILQRKPARWGITFALLAVTMLYAERQTFPRSAHLEVPWNQHENGWQRAFTWISLNTPVDALFALDAHYVTQPGEDAQTFRAIAERSALADYSKDGGEASITPDLTAAWAIGQAAQTGLNTASDAARLASLKPLGVNWVVLPSAAATRFACAYTDEAVKVCRLPAR